MKRPEQEISNLTEWRKDAEAGTASDQTILRKQFLGEVEIAEGRLVKFVITTGDADRENDVISSQGWDVSNYLKNPVVLFAHDYDSLPVARAISLEQEGDTLIAVAEFASAELNPMAERVYQMLKQGFLRGASVGFRPVTFAYNEGRGGVDFAKQELLEFSIVPIPANASALMAAGLKEHDASILVTWAKDLLRAYDPEALETKAPISDQLDDFLDVIRKMMNDIKVSVRETIRNVDEFQNTFQYTTPRSIGDDERIAKKDKGIAPKNVSEETAPMDAPWRKPSLGDYVDQPWDDLDSGERKRIAGHYAWATSAEPEAFGEMKLPHHRPEDGYVVWRGVVAASGRLDQTDFPSADMEAVKNHLAKHFREFDREPPWERDSASWSAFVKARKRREQKSNTPIKDIELAALLHDYGFEDEAVGLVMGDATSDVQSHSWADAYQAQMLSALQRIEGRLKETSVQALQEVQPRTEGLDKTELDAHDFVLELDDHSDDLVEIDSADLVGAMRSALRDSVGTVVGAEMKSAINALRGRLD